jgi:hypothetical protein
MHSITLNQNGVAGGVEVGLPVFQPLDVTVDVPEDVHICLSTDKTCA